ncbi:CAP domain-containing protein [Noviherbaspirillum agri]
MASLSFVLAACGGGDGASESTPSPQPEQAPSNTPSQSAAPAPGPADSTSPTAPVTAGGLPADKTCGIPGFQQQIVTLINQARASARTCGSTSYPAVAAMGWNSKLFDAAAAHALDMASNNYFSHDSRDGRSFSDRITAAGYTWSAAGENIAAGYANAEGVMQGWLDSPGHCANIMSGNFTEVAVSCVRNDSAAYRYYWAMELAHPR